MRDPRKNPVQGGMITRFGTTREVTAFNEVKHYLALQENAN